MNVAPGAFTNAAASDQVGAFTGTFRYDVQLLQVVATVPPVNGVFTLPSPLTYDVTFNEPINPASVQPGDLLLSGIAGSTVTAASVLPGDTTVRFTLNVPTEGALTASILAGAITDAFGNVGAAFTGGYFVDIGTLPYPTPLLAKNPLGSLIYDPTIMGIIGSAGDTDSFTLAIDPAQTVTAIVSGSGGLQPSIELRNPSSTVIGSATSAAANQPALLQTVPATTGGTYTFRVSGAVGSTGNYSLQVFLNAARELEGTIFGATNNTLATAQDINSSFIKLQSSLASVSRGAVNGGNTAAPSVPFQTFNFESGQQGFVINNGPQPSRVAGLWHLSTRRGPESGHSPVTSFYFGQEATGNYNVGATAGSITSGPIVVPNNSGVGLAFNYVLQTEGNGSFDVASVQVSNNGGATFTTIASSASPVQLPLSGVWRNASFSLAAFAGQTVLIRFSFDTTDSILNSFEGWYVDDVQVTTPGDWHDYYSFSASANDAVSAVLENLSGVGTNVFLEDCAGTVLATGSGGATNYDSGIGNFVITTGGTYFLRVSGTVAASYNLVVARNAAFDTEGNDTIATAQSLNSTQGVLGHVTGGAAPVSLQNFDDGVLTGYTFIAPNNASVTAAAAHDGPFGLQLEAGAGGWMWRNDSAVAVQQGDTISAWVRAAGAPTGRLYVGFGASATGTLSMVLAGSTNQLLLQRNPAFVSEEIGMVPQTWEANKWYRFEIVWGVGGSITGRLFDSDGTTLLNTVTATDNTITSGGLAFRSFGPTHYVDSVQKGGQANEDWYSITAIQGLLQFETSTPADGPGEFVNTLDPHIRLYDSTGTTLIATGTPLADGRNESINVPGLPAPANYLVRVTGEGNTRGEYFLRTGAPPFSGFLPPIGKDQYQAGSTMPLKFGFGLNLGLDILVPGSPVSRQINCSPNNCGANVGIGPWGPTQSVPGLHYDPIANQYIYNWKTSKDWAGTCRELDVILRDGRHFRINVRFK